MYLLVEPQLHIQLRIKFLLELTNLTALAFFPFASLLTVLLYFDLVNQEGQVNSDHFSKLATQFFGIGSENSNRPETPPQD